MDLSKTYFQFAIEVLPGLHLVGNGSRWHLVNKSVVPPQEPPEPEDHPQDCGPAPVPQSLEITALQAGFLLAHAESLRSSFRGSARPDRAASSSPCCCRQR